jgi:hypothetical protein
MCQNIAEVSESYRRGEAGPAALFNAFLWVINDVLENRLQKKAVVSFSAGMFYA